MVFMFFDFFYVYDVLVDGGMLKEMFEFYYDKYYKVYVDKFNELVVGIEWEGKSLEDIVKGIYQLGVVVQNGIFNNVSQYWNYVQFWEMMGLKGVGMFFELEQVLIDFFGLVDEFKKKFLEVGVGQFGLGWVWLVKDIDGGLKVIKIENGVNLLCFGQIVFLGCDVWEYSYYIDFCNVCLKYLENFLMNFVNWENVVLWM